MTIDFFAKDSNKMLEELKEELYRRLVKSRELVASYDADKDNLSYSERGYRIGVNEEVMYLEKLLNSIEKI